jgi:hypothetical protein
MVSGQGCPETTNYLSPGRGTQRSPNPQPNQYCVATKIAGVFVLSSWCPNPQPNQYCVATGSGMNEPFIYFVPIRSPINTALQLSNMSPISTLDRSAIFAVYTPSFARIDSNCSPRTRFAQPSLTRDDCSIDCAVPAAAGNNGSVQSIRSKAVFPTDKLSSDMLQIGITTTLGQAPDAYASDSLLPPVCNTILHTSVL